MILFVMLTGAATLIRFSKTTDERQPESLVTNLETQTNGLRHCSVLVNDMLLIWVQLNVDEILKATVHYTTT
jgi:hypothetical protein